MKTCTKCRVSKPDGSYYVKKGKAISICKACCLILSNDWRSRNRKRVAELTRVRWNKLPEEEKNRQRKLHRDWLASNNEHCKEYKKQWIRDNIERTRETWRRNGRISRKRYPEKERARGIINRNIRLGKVVPPISCTRCGQSAKLHAHHPDYSKPLDVIWVCIPCHTALHAPSEGCEAG